MKKYQKRVMAVGVILALVLSTAMVLLPRRASADTTTIEPPLMDTTVDQSDPDADLGREQRLNVESTSSYETAGLETIIIGTKVSGSIGDTQKSDDIYVQYQEAQTPSTTYLDPDTDAVIKGSKSGNFPVDLTSDNWVYVNIAETTQGGTAPPSFRAVGPMTADATPHADFVVTLPTGHAANDILVLMVMVRAQGDTATVSGYAPFTGSPWDRNTVSRYWLFWKRDSGSESNPTVDFTGTLLGDAYAFIIAYKDAITTGNPWEVVGSPGSGTTDPAVFPAITTLSANALVVLMLMGEDNNNAACTTTGTDPVNYVEHYDETAIGADAMICPSEAARATPGSTGTVSLDFDVANPVGWGGMLLSLKALPPSGYEADYRVGWSGESCTGTTILAVSAHHTAGENFEVWVADSTELIWFGPAITITATSDPSPMYQTYELTPDQWDSGSPDIRFVDFDADTTQHILYLDDVRIRCESLSDYKLDVQYDWMDTLPGTQWVLRVEGYHDGGQYGEDFSVEVLTPPSTWITRILIDDHTDTDQAHSYMLTSEEYNGGYPSIRFVDTYSVVPDPTPNNLYLDWVIIEHLPHANKRSLIKFDLSGYGQIDWTSITSATLEMGTIISCLAPIFPPPILPQVGELYRVKSFWADASATWNHQPDYAASPESTTDYDSLRIWDVTNLVKDWLSGRSENYGMMLRYRFEDGDADGRLFSCTFGSRESQNLFIYPPPKLTIVHAPITGTGWIGIEIVEPQDNAVLTNGCTCPILKSKVEHHGAIIDVWYEVTTTDPGSTWMATLPATYEYHTGLWIAQLDCSKLENIYPTWRYKITARATVVDGTPAEDFILIDVINEWNNDRKVEVFSTLANEVEVDRRVEFWSTFAPETADDRRVSVWTTVANESRDTRRVRLEYTIYGQLPSAQLVYEYAKVIGWDGTYHLYEVEIQASSWMMAASYLSEIDVIYPNTWNIVNSFDDPVTNQPEVTVFVRADGPSNFRAVILPGPTQLTLAPFTVYKLWFQVNELASGISPPVQAYEYAKAIGWDGANHLYEVGLQATGYPEFAWYPVSIRVQYPPYWQILNSWEDPVTNQQFAVVGVSDHGTYKQAVISPSGGIAALAPFTEYKLWFRVNPAYGSVESPEPATEYGRIIGWDGTHHLVEVELQATGYPEFRSNLISIRVRYPNNWDIVDSDTDAVTNQQYAAVDVIDGGTYKDAIIYPSDGETMLAPFTEYKLWFKVEATAWSSIHNLVPAYEYAYVSDWDGRHKLYELQLQATTFPDSDLPHGVIYPVALIVHYPTYWEILNSEADPITNQQFAVVSFNNPGGYKEASITPIGAGYLSPFTVYKLWFLVDNLWYR